MELITSRSNPLCVHLRKLAASVSARSGTGRIPLRQPQAAGRKFCSGSRSCCAPWSAPAGTALPALPKACDAVEVPEDLMQAHISRQGRRRACCPSVHHAEPPLPERLDGRHYVVLDGVQDPETWGRSCARRTPSVADGLLLVNACADPYSPKTVRASMGAVFRCPVWSWAPEELRGAAGAQRPAFVWCGIA
jgi:TrmH family RNA methyltransferase